MTDSTGPSRGSARDTAEVSRSAASEHPTVVLSDGVPAEPADDAEAQAPEPQRPRSRALLFLRDVAIVVVSAIVISFLIKTFLIRSFYIPSESMVDTLEVNDRIIVNQLEPDLMPISRGDVIVFEDPGGWLSTQPPEDNGPVGNAVDWFLEQIGLQASDANDHLIKRVIGLPGDEVACCTNGELTVNGVPIDESPYLNEPERKASGMRFDVVVPEGSLWVMGDNRYSSADSRAHMDQPGGGFVPISKVVGRAILITWPVDRWTWLDNHEVVFDDVPTASAGG